MGASFPVVISFATPSYHLFRDQLVRSLVRFGLEHQVVLKDDQGSWERNCNQKPAFIFEELVRRNAPVLWLDADAEVVEYPVLFSDPDFDFAVCKRPELGFGSGTVYFGPRAIHLAALWQELALRSPQEWDQRLLESASRVLEAANCAPSTFFLPESYLQKIDHPEGAVILQHQASRTMRRQ